MFWDPKLCDALQEYSKLARLIQILNFKIRKQKCAFYFVLELLRIGKNLCFQLAGYKPVVSLLFNWLSALQIVQRN